MAMKTRKLTELALLAALALAIFLVELRIPNPIPIPGVKLGLANIVTVYAIYQYRPGEVLLLVMTRILLGGIFGGNLMSLLYSMAGGLLCLAGMIPLHHIIPGRLLWTGSVLGAALHNAGQIAAAVLVTRTPGVIACLPVLLVAGCCAGAFTGLCAQCILKRNAVFSTQEKIRPSAAATGRRTSCRISPFR